MIKLIITLIPTSPRQETVGGGRKWDFAGRKITFLIYCATQTGREEEAAGPELTPPSQLSPGGALAGATNKGPRGRRLWSMMGLRCLDGPEVSLRQV